MSLSIEHLHQYIFTGKQGYNPFSITVIATSENEARERALSAVSRSVRKQLLERRPEWLTEERAQKWEEMKTEWLTKEEAQKMLEKVPVPTMLNDDVEYNIGNYCKNSHEFFEPVFRHPLDEYKNVSFDVWIRYAEVSKKKFNPFTTKVYSCLDG